MDITAFSLAQRWVGLKEVPGSVSNGFILGMLKMDAQWPDDDDVPWCSAFANFICWQLRLPRSKSLRARSWLTVGESIRYLEAKVGFDVVVMSRGGGPQPGADVIDAPGHVGFFAGVDPGGVEVLGGNQGDSVSVQRFPASRVLSVRRLWPS